MMITGRKFLLLFVGIGVFTVISLYSVRTQRTESIRRYFSQPRVGDIYKMEKQSHQAGRVVYYLKIKDVGSECIYFFPGKSKSDAMTDVLLSHFDTSEIEVITKKEILAIKEGAWYNSYHDHTTILEIERK